MNKVTSPSTNTGVASGGYPQGHSPSMQYHNSRGNQPPFRKRGACFFCGKEGHFKRDCRAWQRARQDSAPATHSNQSVARENFQASGKYWLGPHLQFRLLSHRLLICNLHFPYHLHLLLFHRSISLSKAQTCSLWDQGPTHRGPIKAQSTTIR